MQLKIVKYPNPVLTLVSQPIELINGVLSTKDHRIAYDLMDTLISLQDTAIGLSAPQVGHSLRIIAINVYKPILMINPVLTKSSISLTELNEGCLSFETGFTVAITRSKRITVEYTDMQGKQHKLNFSGLEAKAIQHEIDHLNGILMIDKDPSIKFMYDNRDLMAELAKEEEKDKLR